jgi:hypothetical protein
MNHILPAASDTNTSIAPPTSHLTRVSVATEVRSPPLPLPTAPGFASPSTDRVMVSPVFTPPF